MYLAYQRDGKGSGNTIATIKAGLLFFVTTRLLDFFFKSLSLQSSKKKKRMKVVKIYMKMKKKSREQQVTHKQTNKRQKRKTECFYLIH